MLQKILAAMNTLQCVVGGTENPCGECTTCEALKQLRAALPLGFENCQAAVWSHPDAPPEIGAEVVTRVYYSKNDSHFAVQPDTKGVVTGYAVEHGYLYALVKFTWARRTRLVYVAGVDLLLRLEQGKAVQS